MRFERLDLNLLAALDVLIDERSVSAAAKRLHLSQPAVSGALNRLRDFFEDDLLVQSGRQMVLTPKAEELSAPIREALMLIRTRITTPARFDPETSDRTFRIIASDYVFTILLSDILAHFSRTAPNLTFEVMLPEQRTVDLLERGEVDLLITLDSYVKPDFPQSFLFEDEFSVVCWSESPLAVGITEQDFKDAKHAINYMQPGQFAPFAESFFERHKIERRAAIYVPSFFMLPSAVIGTDRIATLQRRYAEYAARQLPIAVHALPFEMPKLREAIQWHPMRASDPGLSWLVSIIRKRVTEIMAE